MIHRVGNNHQPSPHEPDAPSEGISRALSSSSHILVPKLCLGTHASKLCFA
jgi:hypothetical protein